MHNGGENDVREEEGRLSHKERMDAGEFIVGVVERRTIFGRDLFQSKTIENARERKTEEKVVKDSYWDNSQLMFSTEGNESEEIGTIEKEEEEGQALKESE